MICLAIVIDINFVLFMAGLFNLLTNSFEEARLNKI